MQVRDFLGIRVAECDSDEAVARDWSTLAEPVDVVRVGAPPAETWTVLEAAGFVCKPDRVTWVASTADSRERFFERLSFKDRQNLRRAERRAADAGLRLDVVQPVDECLLDPFLALYAEQIRRMRHGLEVALRERDAILADPAYFAVAVRDRDGALAGACLAHEPSGDDVLVRIRFSAVHAAYRDASLARVLYLRAVDEARARGHRQVSLGNDPNLYGHIPKPGLYSFKARLGFAPVAPQHLPAGERSDQADLVLRLDALTDPALIVAYLPGEGGSVERLGLEIVATDADLDLRPYRLGLPAEPRVRRPHHTTAAAADGIPLSD